MLSKNFALSTLVVLLVAFSILNIPHSVFADTAETDARSAIVAAQRKLVVCYQAVTNISDAGANVTGLILVLNQAGGDLSRADLAYDMGDFSSEQSYAVQSLNLLVQSDVVARASALRSTTSQASYWDFVINIVGSLVGAVVVICGGFVAWMALKNRYAKAGGVAK